MYMYITLKHSSMHVHVQVVYVCVYLVLASIESLARLLSL